MDRGAWRRHITALLASVAVVTGCGSTPSADDSGTPTSAAPDPAAEAPAAGPNRIAFVRSEADIPLLWTANIDGSDAEPVGDQSAWFPDWSPDRTLLLIGFTDENGDDQIATIRPDGEGLNLLTEGAGYNEAPDYSPDGSTIIYAHSDVHEEDPGFSTSLWLMDADGSDKRPLQLDDGGGDDSEPEFSPDGKRIVFMRYRGPDDFITALFVASADGSGVRRLTPWEHLVEHPRWSPDGRTIIYNIENRTDQPSNKREGIWTVPASGGEPELLLKSTSQLHPFKPDYSPDGTRILTGCALEARATEDICVMNADGTGARPIFRSDEWENHVVWD